MTRVCRTKFERDDLNEAMIICGLQKSQPQEVEEQPPSNPDRKIDNVDAEHGPVKRSQIWRAPRIFPFNYTTSPLHAHRNTQRRPIPFENTDICYAPVRAESPQAIECLVHAESKNGEPGPDSSLVSHRPPHPRWDDESDPDHPYDNPHYCKPIGNSLWLPRNPCDVLDLDDTVDLNKALTSSQSSGVLRSYIVNSPSLSSDPPRSSSPEHSPVSVPSPSLQPPAPVQRSLSGNEVIALPPHVVSRIYSASIRAVPQPKRRHTSYGWRERNRPSPSPSTTIHTNDTTWPPVKFSQSEGHPHFRPPHRSASLPVVGRHPPSTSLDPEIAEATGMLPDTQAQVKLPALEHPAAKSTISLAEAVAKEVRIEEEIAEEEDMKEEAEETEESTMRRPWWMRLFFSSVAT